MATLKEELDTKEAVIKDKVNIILLSTSTQEILEKIVY